MPANAVAGDTIDVTWTVANIGVGTASTDWEDAIYLSVDNVFDDEDELLQSRHAYDQSPLPPGSDYLQSIQVELDRAGAGDYYVLVRTDYRSTQPESDEENNVHAVPITLTAPNLIPTELNIPATAVAGQEITAEWIVTNDSDQPSGGRWSDSLYLSADDVFDDSDISLSGNDGLSPLGPGESYTQDRTFQLQGAIGEQFILLVVDEYEEQGETNETDNVLARPITITIDSTNLTPTDFAAPASAASGETIGVTWTVTNDSEDPTTAQWYDAIYLSADNVFDTGDQSLTQIYQGNRAPLAAGASYTETIDVTLQNVRSGAQYLLIVTDSLESQIETDEDDNVRAIPIDISLPNLIVTDISAPSVAVSGDSITVSWMTTNDSPVVAAADWVDTIFLSRDELFDTSDRSLRSVSTGSLTPLAAGESYSTSSSDVQLTRISAGEYFVLVVANSNNAQGETNDYDNVLATPITIVLPDIEAKAVQCAVIGSARSIAKSVLDRRKYQRCRHAG